MEKFEAIIEGLHRGMDEQEEEHRRVVAEKDDERTRKLDEANAKIEELVGTLLVLDGVFSLFGGRSDVWGERERKIVCDGWFDSVPAIVKIMGDLCGLDFMATGGLAA